MGPASGDSFASNGSMDAAAQGCTCAQLEAKSGDFALCPYCTLEMNGGGGRPTSPLSWQQV